MAFIDLSKIKYVTLYTGDNGSASCTCNCPCCSQKGRNRKYQGTMNQALDMFEKLPNMEQLYIFGNPDVTIDTDFCHSIIVEAVNRNINVSFSTSGVGGENTLKRLLNNISTASIDYISFSFDGTTEEEMSFSKGIAYPMEHALKGVEWAINNGYTVKVQPTLWTYNYTKTETIIDYFVSKGVTWFTFHIGSLEAEVDMPSHKHLLPEQINVVHSQIEHAVQKHKNIKVRCPIIYLQCGKNEVHKWYCMHPERIQELLITFTEKGIKATHVPMASIYRNDLSFDLGTSVDIPAISESQHCPFSNELAGRNDTCCRYISKYWNY